MGRILVGLPSPENREMIYKTILAKEKVEEGLDFKELAAMTEGFTGSDLKVLYADLTNFLEFSGIISFFFTLSMCKQNLCTTAAYRPVRELIQQERLKDLVSRSISSYLTFLPASPCPFCILL